MVEILFSAVLAVLYVLFILHLVVFIALAAPAQRSSTGKARKL
jgi:hypothetical protein